MKFMSMAVLAALFATAEAVRVVKDKTLDPPEHFTADSDDIFMRSVHTTYASHPKDKDGKDIESKVILTEGAAKALADEVVGTHKGLDGAAKADYLAAYFQKAWKHFDVNAEGSIEAGMAPMFVRFLLSDPHTNIYSQKK